MANIYDMVDTWNNGATTFTAIKMNVTDTASAAGSLLMDLQVGGVSKISGTKAGGFRVGDGSAAAPSFSFGSTDNTGMYATGGGVLSFAAGGQEALRVLAAGVSIGGGFDAVLTRDAANTLAQRNGTAAQAFRLYNTFTDASNYERLGLRWSANQVFLTTESGGTGVLRELVLGVAGGQWKFETGSGHFQATVDNSYDIGASGASRPRTGYFGTSVLVSGTGGVGYTTGAGGTVTQATDKSTGVTLNKITGEITMNAAALAANTTVSFTLTNSTIAATDLVLITHDSAGTAGAYTVTAQGAAGSANIAVRNVTAGSLSEAIVLKFAVFKAVNS